MAITLQGPDYGGAISRGSSALADALEKRAERRLGTQQRSDLASVLQTADLTTPEGQKQFISAASSKNIPLNQSLDVLDRVIKQQQATSKNPFRTNDPNELSGIFERMGLDPDQSRSWADFYANLSEGGKTSFANMFVDRMMRGDLGSMSMRDVAQASSDIEATDLETTEQEAPKFQWPEVNMFRGLTPKETAETKRDLLKMNNAEIKEVDQAVRASDKELIRIDQLQRLNDSDKLPTGLEKLNIKWDTGDIRFPALANAETQLFVKTINDFTTTAKDTYGARVTNFELGQFMRRLPTLANDPPGRRLIIEQMRTMKMMDRLYDDSIRQVYDKYGTQNIDRATAEQIARNLRSEDEQQLKQKMAGVLDAQDIYVKKKKLPEGKVLGRDPADGRAKGIDADKAKRAVELGWELL